MIIANFVTSIQFHKTSSEGEKIIVIVWLFLKIVIIQVEA